MERLNIDIETYSEADLTKSGVYKYVDKTSGFEVLLFGYSVDGGPVVVIDLAQGQKIPEEIVEAIKNPDVIKYAFNAQFERICLGAYLGEYISPESWRCTMVASLYLGLPGSLAQVGMVLGVEKQKLESGKDLIRYFSLPCKATKAKGGRTRNLPHHDMEKWQQFISYNARDVETEMEIFERVNKFPVPDFLWKQYVEDQCINDLGIELDMDLVAQAIKCDEESKARYLVRAQALTGLENPNSPIQLKEWILAKGVKMETLTKAEVAEVIETSDGEVKEVLELRQLLSKSSVKKYVAMEACRCSDGRAHGLLQFYGANRTGRWAGRLIQVQNLPQNHIPDLKVARDLVKSGCFEAVELLYDSIPDTLSQLIIGGHQRVTVLKDLGYEEIECIVISIDKTKEKALNIALNKITGEWNKELLADLIKDLQESDFDVAFTGFEPPEIEQLFNAVHDKKITEDDFDVEEELKKPMVARPGDVWLLGNHRVVCGDSTLPDTYEVLMAGKKANMVLTDPPYGVDVEETAGKIKNDNLADDEFYKFLFAAFVNMEQSMEQDGSIYIFHADTKGLIFRRAFEAAGFYLSGCCIWKKNSLVLGRSPYQWMHEPCLFGWKLGGKHNWYSDRKQTTIWEYDRPKSSKDHPTMKPVALMAYPIQNSSMSNCIVLDPFLGSGSTLIACEQTNRICYGIELDEKFVDVIVRRYIEQAGTDENVSVIRDGETIAYKDIEKPVE